MNEKSEFFEYSLKKGASNMFIHLFKILQNLLCKLTLHSDECSIEG